MNAKVLCLIQQAVDGPILDHIEESQSAHDALEVLKKQYQGTSKVMLVKIKAFRRDLRCCRWKIMKAFKTTFVGV